MKLFIEKTREFLEEYGLEPQKTSEKYNDEKIGEISFLFTDKERQEQVDMWLNKLIYALYPITFKIKDEKKFIDKTGANLSAQELKNVKAFIKMGFSGTEKGIILTYDQSVEETYKDAFTEIARNAINNEMDGYVDKSFVLELITERVDDTVHMKSIRRDTRKTIEQLYAVDFNEIRNGIVEIYIQQSLLFTKQTKKQWNIGEQNEQNTACMKEEIKKVNEKYGIENDISEKELIWAIAKGGAEDRISAIWNMMNTAKQIISIENFENALLNGSATRFPEEACEYLYLTVDIVNDEMKGSLVWDASISELNTEAGQKIVRSIEPGYDMMKLFEPGQAQQFGDRIIRERLSKYNDLDLTPLVNEYVSTAINVYELQTKEIDKMLKIF